MDSEVAGAFALHVELHAFVYVSGVSCVEGVVVALNNVDVVGH